MLFGTGALLRQLVIVGGFCLSGVVPKGKWLFPSRVRILLGCASSGGVLRHCCFLVNVYFKCCIAEKRVMLEKLLELKSSMRGEIWCVAGDFNSILHESERRGTPFGSDNLMGSEIRLFSAFIDRMRLFGFPFLGRHFT